MPADTASVHWGELEHAYGTAEDIPALLEALQRARGRKRMDVRIDLCSRVLHQGTIYSASPPVARIFIGSAPTAEPELREFYYSMLAGFAEAARQAFSDGRAIPCHAGGDPAHGHAIREAILEAQTVFARELENSSPAIRGFAAELLTAFEDGAPDSTRLVRERYLMESDEQVRLSMLDGLLRTSGLRGDWIEFVTAALARESSAGCRFLLLYALIREQEGTASDAIAEEFVAAHAARFEANGDYLDVDERFFEGARRLGARAKRPCVCVCCRS